MTTIRRIRLSAIAATFGAVAFTAGCGTPTQQFIGAADTFVNTTVGPEYLMYVAADPTLSDAEKEDRRLNVEAFRSAVTEAKALKGGN